MYWTISQGHLAVPFLSCLPCVCCGSCARQLRVSVSGSREPVCGSETLAHGPVPHVQFPTSCARHWDKPRTNRVKSNSPMSETGPFKRPCFRMKHRGIPEHKLCQGCADGLHTMSQEKGTYVLWADVVSVCQKCESCKLKFVLTPSPAIEVYKSRMTLSSYLHVMGSERKISDATIHWLIDQQRSILMCWKGAETNYLCVCLVEGELPFPQRVLLFLSHSQ